MPAANEAALTGEGVQLPSFRNGRQLRPYQEVRRPYGRVTARAMDGGLA
jgi:hypothetical protein